MSVNPESIGQKGGGIDNADLVSLVLRHDRLVESRHAGTASIGRVAFINASTVE